MTVHRTLSALGLAFGLALCSDRAFATTDNPLWGGPGGNEFRADCPPGSYLVGLAGRTVEWVYSIAPVCAPWLRGSQTLGAPSIGPSFGTSEREQAKTETCRNSSSNYKNQVIRSWFIDTLRSANKFVQYVAAMCESLTPSPPRSSEIVWFGFGSSPGDAITYTPYGRPYTGRGGEQSCPAGEAAVGFRVRAGQFVDAIGLICGPIPLGPSTPAAKLPGPLVQAPSPAVTMNPQAKNMRIPGDMFVITKPAVGDRVPQGQLVITATLPKVGVTNVTELELRFLDAPPNQRDSYPYLTVFSVDTPKLLQGYPVGERVTGYVGRWQVRARSSMKASPGPWSNPVQFELLKPSKNQSSPVQMAPLPLSPITQTPQQPAGAGSMMVKPQTMPSQGSSTATGMIRMRGVEEKGGAEDDQKVKAEAEKKP